MFTPRLRLVLAIASFAFGTYRIVLGQYVGLAFLLASAVLAYGYFRYGTVWLAFREVARGKTDAAAKLLSQIKHPSALTSQDRAYFELASGLVAASRANNELAESHLKLALEHELRTENDRALAEAVLAQLLVARGALPEARSVVAHAVTRTCRPAIAQRIQELHDKLAQQ